MNLVKLFPPGRYRDITLDLIAACIAFGKACFTFSHVGPSDAAPSVANAKYGKWDTSFFTSTYIADIKEWLLDEDSVPTEWEPLIRLRRVHNHT